MNILQKPYSTLLPFLVAEAISHKPSFSSMSVRMTDQGWAWLVSGRKLLVWKFKESKSPSDIKSRRMLSPCFELQLPQSDIVHKAELIDIFFMPQNPNVSLRTASIPAAITASPEGTIRFWSNIANERFAELSVVELQGQEFCTLTFLSPLEYLLGTTTGSVFLLTIDIASHDPKGVLICSALATPSGLLSGISRRMTSLFFGPLTVDNSPDLRRPLITVPKYSQSTIDKSGLTDRLFFILSSSMKLRQWSRTNMGLESTNQLIREWDLQKNIQDKLASGLNASNPESISFWPVDMITTKNKDLLILIVALDITRSSAIHYATCIFNPYQANDTISSLTVLKAHSWNYSNESEEQILSLRFLERRATSPQCFMYDRKFLFLIQIDRDILDAIDYGNQDDGILGTGLVDGQAIVFTQRNGMTYVSAVVSDRSCLDDLNETSIQLDLQPPREHDRGRRTTRFNTSHHQASTSNRVEPMLVEIDEDDEELENDVSAKTQNQSVQPGQPALSNNSMLNKSNNPPMRRKQDDVADYIKDHREFEWVQLIDSGCYSEASELLAKLANDEKFADRKDTFLALSRLAKRAE